MSNDRQSNTIAVPRKVIDSMAEAYKKWDEFINEFEDFALSSNKTLLAKMRKARKEHLAGKTQNVSALRKSLHV